KELTGQANPVTNPARWDSSMINLSDADPAQIPGVASPVGLSTLSRGSQGITQASALLPIDALFDESGATAGSNVVLQPHQALHVASPRSRESSAQPFHAGDREPVHLYALDAAGGDISGLTLFSGKAARVVAGRDISDIALFIQNVNRE